MRRGERWAPLLLFVGVAAVYAPSARNGFVYDDHEVILQQAPVRSFEDLARIFAEPHGLPLSRLPYYRATTRATLLVQKGLHGDRAGPFHLGNALLMAAAALAAWDLLRRPRFALSPAAAALGAAGFALHPVASSVVHPIASGRESLMPAIFVVASVSLFLRGGAIARWGAPVCFAVAIFSKEQAIVTPLLLLLADALGLPPDAPGRRAGRWLARHAPIFAVLLGYLGVRSVVMAPAPEAEAAAGQVLEAIRTQLASHPLAPLASPAYALQVVFAPFLDVVYEPTRAVWLSPLRLAWAGAVFAALALGALRLPRADRAAVVFWLLWVPLTMALTLNLWPQETAFAERFVFLPSLGLIALIVTVADRWAAAAGRRRLAGVAGSVLVVALAAASVHRGVHYRDGTAFARQWVATNPHHANARYSLGSALADRGQVGEALSQLRAAVRLEPRLAAAHYNLGVLLAGQARSGEAMASFRNALAADPGDAAAHYALAVLLEQSGSRAEAVEHYRRSVSLAPGWAEPEAGLRRVRGAQ